MKQHLSAALRIFALIAVLAFAAGFAASPAAAAVEIPYGAVVTRAYLTVNSINSYADGGTVQVYRVNNAWDENTATYNNFTPVYGPWVASFYSSYESGPWSRTVDVTSAVQAWLAGTANYGLVLDEGSTAGVFSVFHSSESGALGPSLYVCYTVNGGAETCVTVSGTSNVADVSLQGGTHADEQLGGSTELWTGAYQQEAGVSRKVSLVRFDLTVGQKPPEGPGTGTPGYWKNHPEAWPVTSLTIGGVTYTQEQILPLMTEDPKDKTTTLFRALVSAKLNVLIGNTSSCVAGTISAADAWMAMYGPVGSGVLAKSDAWKTGEPLYLTLDAYNNGLLCAPHRD